MDFFEMEKRGKNKTDEKYKKPFVRCFEQVKTLIEDLYGNVEEDYNFFCVDVSKSRVAASEIVWLNNFLYYQFETMQDELFEYLADADVKEIRKLQTNNFSFDFFNIDQIWIAFAEKSKVFMKIKPYVHDDTLFRVDYEKILRMYNGFIGYSKEMELIEFDLSFFIS